MNREELSKLILSKLEKNKSKLKKQWESSHPTRHFHIDNLLPTKIANEINNSLPQKEKLSLRNSLKEKKWVGNDIKNYENLVGDILLSFQNPEIVKIVEEITGHTKMKPDPELYASGISIMGKGDFLNPHLDNSHSEENDMHRIVNLLYYVSPNWKLSNGGNLELWKNNVKDRVTIESKFNRLVVMETTPKSWHSVSKITVNKNRCCVSNYYFSKVNPFGSKYKHVTSFTGRPEEKIKRIILKTDSRVKNLAKRIYNNIDRK